MLQGVVAGRYWVTLQWNGTVTIVDSDKLGKIETDKQILLFSANRCILQHHKFHIPANPLSGKGYEIPLIILGSKDC